MASTLTERTLNVLRLARVRERLAPTPKHTFTLSLTQAGHHSIVLLDWQDIAGLLRGVVVRSSVCDPTRVELNVVAEALSRHGTPLSQEALEHARRALSDAWRRT